MSQSVSNALTVSSDKINFMQMKGYHVPLYIQYELQSSGKIFSDLLFKKRVIQMRTGPKKLNNGSEKIFL